MNVKRFVMAVIAAFVFIFGFEFVVHAIVLSDTYEATAHLWRPMESHADYFHFMVLSQLAQAFMMAYIFTLNYEGKGLHEGLRFGLYVGLLLAAIELGAYCYLPVPFALVASWMGASLFKGLGVGAVLALVYRK